MNCQMQQITVTYRDGRMATLENVYIRGSKIRFLILPDMLKNAPMFKNNKSGNKSGTAGRGKSAILRAQGKNFTIPVSNEYFGYLSHRFQPLVEEEEDLDRAGRKEHLGQAKVLGKVGLVVVLAVVDVEEAFNPMSDNIQNKILNYLPLIN